MRLVDDDPVRPPGPDPQRRELRQELEEESRPLLEREAGEVHDDVGVGLLERRQDLLDARRAIGSAEDDGLRERPVIAFRIDDARLIPRRRDPLE